MCCLREQKRVFHTGWATYIKISQTKKILGEETSWRGPKNRYQSPHISSCPLQTEYSSFTTIPHTHTYDNSIFDYSLIYDKFDKRTHFVSIGAQTDVKWFVAISVVLTNKKICGVHAIWTPLGSLLRLNYFQFTVLFMSLYFQLPFIEVENLRIQHFIALTELDPIYQFDSLELIRKW